MTNPTPGAPCPSCGAERVPDALFCEQCGHDFAAGSATSRGVDTLPDVAPDSETAPRPVPATPVTARAGEESPLDVGWTGPIAARPTGPDAATAACLACGGGFVDGYCDRCGLKQPDPRDHYREAPATWVAGVCDIGRRHTRNEDALALSASREPLESAVLVVCDGVSRATDSHVASLAACRAAREVLAQPIPRAMGRRPAIVGAIERRLEQAVLAARDAVVGATSDAQATNPPSCTLVAAVVDDGTAVVGSVGDSRAYWLPEAADSPARQVSTDDSFAAQRMLAGVSRQEAETGPEAHAITRWLGADSPPDLTPHTASLDLDEDGWLLVCSDGLWNYCSDAAALRDVVTRTQASLGTAGRHPPTLAQALVDYANASGGSDNITVALARVGPTAPAPQPGDPPDPTPTTPAIPPGEDA